jgi:D-alanine transaminase
MISTAYLNGQFLPLSEARISPMDRGFLLADGIYEMIPVYAGRPFRWPSQLARLKRSMAAIDLKQPMHDDELLNLIKQLTERAYKTDLLIYLQITRGTEPSRNHYYQADTQPTVFAYTTDLPSYTLPLKVITTPDMRWQRCDIKSISLLPNALARHQAYLQGATEALLVRDGYVNEGSSSNIFIVKQEMIITPAKSPAILAGLSRELVLELAQIHQLPYQERPITESELYTADEVWITSVGRKVQPITAVNGKLIKQGNIGPIWQQMMKLYDKAIEDHRHGRK